MYTQAKTILSTIAIAIVIAVRVCVRVGGVVAVIFSAYGAISRKVAARRAPPTYEPLLLEVK